MRRWTGSAWVQVMACRLFGAKSLPEPMLAYCQLDPYEQSSVKFQSKFKHYHWRKGIWKCRLQFSRKIVLGEMDYISGVYAICHQYHCVFHISFMDLCHPFTYIFQGYLLGLGQSHGYPSSDKAIPKDMVRSISNKPEQNTSANHVHESLYALYRVIHRK